MDIRWTCPHCKNRNATPQGAIVFHCLGCGDLIDTRDVQAQQPPGVKVG